MFLFCFFFIQYTRVIYLKSRSVQNLTSSARSDIYHLYLSLWSNVLAKTFAQEKSTSWLGSHGSANVPYKDHYNSFSTSLFSWHEQNYFLVYTLHFLPYILFPRHMQRLGFACNCVLACPHDEWSIVNSNSISISKWQKYRHFITQKYLHESGSFVA